MGEAKRKAVLSAGNPTARLRRLFGRLGIDPDQVAFHNSPAFVAAEKANPSLLNEYAEWVFNRPRSPEYNDYVRKVVPLTSDILATRLGDPGTVASCLNASGALSGMLDRLGVWSFVLRGSANIRLPKHPDKGVRYWWDIDSIDHEGGITGHAWVCAPPFLIVDVTLKNQPWGDDVIFGDVLPAAIVQADATRIKPMVTDVVCNDVRNFYALKSGRLDKNLHYRLVHQLAKFEQTFGAWQADVGEAEVRYVPNAVTAPDVPLEEIGMIGPRGFGDIWRDDILPLTENDMPCAALLPGS